MSYFLYIVEFLYFYLVSTQIYTWIFINLKKNENVIYILKINLYAD